MNKAKYILIILLFPFVVANAQNEAEQNTMEDGTIEEQFEYILKKSNKYKEGGNLYRVIKDDILSQLETNVDGEINKLETDLSTSNQTISNQKTEIESLESELLSTNEKLTKVNKEKNNMNFLGIVPMKKGAYRSIMWAIIAGLGIFLLLFIFQYLRSNAVTKQNKKLLVQAREEFNAYKNKSMEDEQKLRRRLQDEINKRL